MRCDLLCVGTELLLGQIVNTNASEIGAALAEAGIDSIRHSVVGDNRSRIMSAIRDMISSADALIVTGGLGPTHDDVTRDAMAELMGVELIHHPELEERIRQHFEKHRREMSGNNVRQAFVPDGAEIIDQTVGTAPGLICLVDSKPVFLLPGVPSEMREMMDRVVIPKLREQNNDHWVIESRNIRTWGITESSLGEALVPLIDNLDEFQHATIALLAQGAKGNLIRVSCKAPTKEEARVIIDAEETRIRERVGEYIFGVDDDTLESIVAAAAVANRVTIGVAESLTGGMLSSLFVNVPGASVWFRGGVVSYDSEVKFSVLDVDRGPVVSEKAASQMAEGVRRLLDTQVGLSVTGVAGPTDQDGEPVGTVIVGISDARGTVTQRFHVGGSREQIRERAASWALDSLRRRLDDGAGR